MEYHYQWPEYLDPTSPEGSGWESMCASPPPFCADTPAVPSCITRVFPRGRPMRRRRLFPPPFNHFARGARPQWSTPYYDCRYKWTPEPHVTKVCSPQFDNCCDYESLLDKTNTDKQPQTPAKKVRKSRGNSQQSKPVQAVKNNDQALLGSHRIDWIDNSHQSECNSPSGTLPIAQHSSLSSPIDYLCKSPGREQEFSQSTLISGFNNETRKTKSSQNDFPVSVKVSAELGEKYFVENKKEDALTSLINRTIFEESNDATNNCPDITGSHQNQLGGEPTKPCEESCLINKSLDSSQNVTDGNTELVSSSQRMPKNSSSAELFYSGSVENFSNDFFNEAFNEADIAVFNIQQLDQPNDSDAKVPISYGNQVLTSSHQNLCNGAKTDNSLVVFDPSEPEQAVDENITVVSDSKVNTKEVQSSSNAQFPTANNSNPSSSEKDDSISALVQQNQLLTDLLSQLISGDIEFQKNVFASNKLQPEAGNSTGETQVNISEASTADCVSLHTVSGEDPANIFQNVPTTEVNVPAEVPLPSFHAQDTSVTNCWNEQLTKLNEANTSKYSDKITKSCEVTSASKVHELTPNNSLVMQASDFSIPVETFPSKIDYPSSDSDSNFREATLSSVTNYLLEEPLDSFPDSLISVFDDDSSQEILSSCVKPNSVLKVKKPRKRYVKTVESFKVKKREKKFCGASSKCKKLTNKCLKMIRKCKHKICKEEERNSDEDYRDSVKVLRDAEVQVKESDIAIMMGNGSRTHDVETQYEATEDHCDNLQGTISLKKELQRHYECANSTFATDENPNSTEKNNVIKNDDVFVMLVEIPLNMKKMPMETGSLKVEVPPEVPAKPADCSEMTADKGIILKSFATISDLKNKSFSNNYDDSYEARPPTKSKRNYNQDSQASGSDNTTPISKSRQSNDRTKEISHVPKTMSGIQRSANVKITPELHNRSDRVLRKRKAVNYSDPGPSKRKRIDCMEFEVELDTDKQAKKMKNLNLNSNLKRVDKNNDSGSNKIIRHRNSSPLSRDKLSSKEQHSKSLRPKTR